MFRVYLSKLLHLPLLLALVRCVSLLLLHNGSNFYSAVTVIQLRFCLFMFFLSLCLFSLSQEHFPWTWLSPRHSAPYISLCLCVISTETNNDKHPYCYFFICRTCVNSTMISYFLTSFFFYVYFHICVVSVLQVHHKERWLTIHIAISPLRSFVCVLSLPLRNA